jgi:hypothetical protein
MVVVRLPELASVVLNDVGARVWELATGRTAEEIARILRDETGAPLERITHDVASFLVALEADRVVTRST